MEHNNDYEFEKSIMVKSALGEALAIEIDNSKIIHKLRAKILELQAEVQGLHARIDDLERRLAQYEVV